MDHSLVVAMADPFNVTVLDDLRLLTGKEVRAVVTTPRQISEAIEQSYMEKMFRDIDEMQTEEVVEEDIGIAGRWPGAGAPLRRDGRRALL